MMRRRVFLFLAGLLTFFPWTPTLSRAVDRLVVLAERGSRCAT